jgi:hypothetical protein
MRIKEFSELKKLKIINYSFSDKYLGRSPNFSLAIPKLKLGLLL